ncbi:hypothetical protein EI546_10840 [Aequorivita sp. H23M31]|uniref:Sialate O-acetylesterase domain-containing protein n=1 Tax=Aequorivita ciconiae TaxID=2494375 RepID=A0A410G4I4_9FLAO|nr:sialate O-acetylesterase [Aequorivita sp. H23M31]QAA82188.1 hypothetical protein EI546_10840 [Aequorivita sp. H23M31]
MKGTILSILLCWFIFSCADKKNESVQLFVIAGQSNAMGVGDSSQSIIGEEPCYEYDSKKDSFVTLKDPVGQDDMHFHVAKTGSFIPSFAYNYAKITHQPIYVVQCAKGGSSLSPKAEVKDWGNWDPSGKLLSSSFKKIDLALSALKDEGKGESKLAAIIWSQGENDGEAIGKGNLTAEEYKAGLKNLISEYRERFGSNLPFVIIETGRHASCKECDEGYAIVRKIQGEVAAEDKYTFIGYNETKDFIERKWLKDPVHYNQDALNDIGKKLAKFMVEHNIL